MQQKLDITYLQILTTTSNYDHLVASGMFAGGRKQSLLMTARKVSGQVQTDRQFQVDHSSKALQANRCHGGGAASTGLSIDSLAQEPSSQMSLMAGTPTTCHCY